jgi:hypothetical protein
MRILPVGLVVVVFCACGTSSPSNDAPDSGTGSGSGSGARSSGSGTGRGATNGSSGSGSGTGRGSMKGGSGTGSGSGSSGPSGSDAGGLPTAGNPYGSCKALTLPSEAQAVDTSHPTTVVGTGTAESCTFAALAAAVTKGGIITFDCGDAVATIPITATLTPPISTGSQPAVNVVIDGGGKIILDGGSVVRIVSWMHDTWRTSKDTLTLQHIELANGKTSPTEAIAACTTSPSTNCPTGFDDGQGGAIDMQDGSLRVIDCTFDGNQAALLGPDTGGGAMYLFGTGVPSYIAGSTFKNNKASNAGAIGMLWAGAFIYNSLFDSNSAVGTGANNVDATMCSCSNMGNANQTGSGGNGGAIYKDGGDGAALTLCGTQIQNNTANEFGAGVFLTADGSGAQLIIDDTVIKNNSTPEPYWEWCTGVSTDNPHMSGSSTGSPSPIDSSFCGTTGMCSMTCSS